MAHLGMPKSEKVYLLAWCDRKINALFLINLFAQQRTKKILEEKLGNKITLLAWPFGIYDPYLEQEAAKAGYVMAFSIDAHTANRNYRPMAQPRFMIIEGQSMKTFMAIVNGVNAKPRVMSAKINKNE